MIPKISIPVFHQEVAPRFDLATEAVIILLSKNNTIEEERTIVLPRASADDLCHLLLAENINTLICGAIEDEYYQFLKWKKIDIFDSVAGKWLLAFKRWQQDKLISGDIISDRIVEGKYV